VWGDRLQLMFVEWFTAFYAVIATGVLVLSLYCVWQDNTQPSKRTRERPAQRSSALGELVEDHIKQR
jgi:heme/copper-type cytochrome/quinol oxidase subunit 2